MVYVAGHGTLELGPQGTELYLLPSDGWLADATSSGIRVVELAEHVAALPARRTVVILDTCYSGDGRSGLSPQTRTKVQGLRGPIPAPPALLVSEFSAHLYAAHVRQPAIEDPSLANGVYTHFLVEGLRGAGDLDGDGLVEVMEAHGYARDRTLEYTGGSQVPWAETVSVGRQAVFLAGDPSRRRAAEEAILVGLEGLPLGASLTVDGVPRGGGPVQLGDRRLEVRDGQRVLLSEHIQARPGDRINVASRLRGRWTRTSLSVGASASPDSTWLGQAGVWGGFDLAPPDPGGPRWVVGLESGVGALAGSATGTWAATVGAEAPIDGFAVGMSVGGGGVWRRPPDRPEAAPLLLPALTARTAGRWFGSMELSGPIFLADAGVVTTPRLVLALGTTLSTR